MKFEGKTFWVTGASSGMGKSVAIALSKFKTRIIISDIDIDGLEDTAKKIKQNHSTVRIEQLDMSNNKNIIDTAKKVLDDGENIAGLYQFAGISQRSLTVETPIEVDRKIMEINYFGIVALTKAILPFMIKNGGGQLVAASSLVGKFGFPYRSAYSASKHALHGFFETILAENHKNKIKVSMIIGGRIQTNISKFALNRHGNTHGTIDKGQAKGITPEKAAQQIITGLNKDRNEILVGGSELFVLKIKKFLPGLHYRIARRIKPM